MQTEMTVALRGVEDKKVTLEWVASQIAQAAKDGCRYASELFQYFDIDPECVHYSWAAVCYIASQDGVEYYTNDGAGFDTPEEAIAAIREKCDGDPNLEGKDVVFVASDNVVLDGGWERWYDDYDGDHIHAVAERLRESARCVS